MRDKKHYEDMLNKNPGASIGYTLAADAVFASRSGFCEAADHQTEPWRKIARGLKQKYGENLTVEEVRAEMSRRYSKGSTSVSIAIPADLLEELNDVAGERGVSRNSLIVQAIRDILEKLKR